MLLGNDSSHNFAKLGEQYLKAAKATNEDFQHRFEWPTFTLVYLSLELYLKSHLARHGFTEEQLRRRIGHNIRLALAESKTHGLTLNLRPGIEDLVLDISTQYTNKDFQYRSIGSFDVTFPDLLIEFVEQVRIATGN